MLVLDNIRQEFAKFLSEDPSGRWRMDAALAHVVQMAYQQGIEDGALDAKRYRWLRSPSVGPSQIWELLSDGCSPPVMTLKCTDALDSAIGSAMENK